MIRRIRSWRTTPTGIWCEWFACAALLIAATATSAALGWHWAITGLLAAITVIVCGLLILLLSVRNDLGEQDRIDAIHRHNDEAMKQSANHMTGPED